MLRWELASCGSWLHVGAGFMWELASPAMLSRKKPPGQPGRRSSFSGNTQQILQLRSHGRRKRRGRRSRARRCRRSRRRRTRQRIGCTRRGEAIGERRVRRRIGVRAEQTLAAAMATVAAANVHLRHGIDAGGRTNRSHLRFPCCGGLLCQQWACQVWVKSIADESAPAFRGGFNGSLQRTRPLRCRNGLGCQSIDCVRQFIAGDYLRLA